MSFKNYFLRPTANILLLQIIKNTKKCACFLSEPDCIIWNVVVLSRAYLVFTRSKVNITTQCFKWYLFQYWIFLLGRFIIRWFNQTCEVAGCEELSSQVICTVITGVFIDELSFRSDSLKNSNRFLKGGRVWRCLPMKTVDNRINLKIIWP